MAAQEQIMPHAYFHGQFVPFKDAQLSIANQSVQYGLTCFGGVRGYYYDGRRLVFRLQDHFWRMKEGLKLLGLELHFQWEEFQQLVKELIERNAPDRNFYIRPFFHSESLALGPRLRGMPFQLAIYMIYLGDYFGHSNGLRLQISSWRKFSDAAMPTKAKAGGCYLNAALAKSEAQMNGYDDALMMDENGYIVEGSVANLFIARRGQLLMPATGSALLEGITRRTVVELLAQDGIGVEAVQMDRSMVYTAEEMFLSGTAAQLAFVQAIDGRQIGTQAGPFFKLLEDKFQAVIQGHNPLCAHWLTEY